MSIVIRIEALLDGARTGDDELPAEVATRLGPDFGIATPLRARWRAQRVHQVVEVRARIEGALSFGCSRCGDPLTLPVRVDVQHHWVGAGSLDDGEDALDPDDPDVSEHDGVSFDLEPVLIDAVVVEVPYAPACVDAAEGRCPTFSEAPIVYHAGGPPPDDGERHRPFAALLAGKAGAEPAEG